MDRFVIALLLALGSSAVEAQVTEPPVVSGTARTVAAGPLLETDPHVSGSRVVYTFSDGAGSTRTAKIHVFDLITGTTTALGQDGDFIDTISDISGDAVVFTRQSRTGETQAIAFVDLSEPALTVRELAPEASPRRTNAAVAGDTVAFQQQVAGFTFTEICVASLSNYLEPAHCLTNDDSLFNLFPSVSADGRTVVFQKCSSRGGPIGVGCDIYAARLDSLGVWSAPVAITSGGANDVLPRTNGETVVYASDATGDYDLYYEPVTGMGTPTRLELTDLPGSHEWNTNISGTLVSMERRPPDGGNADLYVFDIASNWLVRLTATPDINEHLNDIAVDGDGIVHVVWASVDPLAPDNRDNVYALSFVLSPPSYEVCPVFDVSKSFKAGRVVPLRIRLCDATGANLSSPEILLTATGLVQLDATASSVVAADSPGEANTDGVFRYDAALGGYVFNLTTNGLASGTWELRFHVSDDGRVYAVRFDIK